MLFQNGFNLFSRKMAALSFCRKFLVGRILERSGRISCRLLTTSEKKKESNEQCPPLESIYKKVPDFSKPLENKNWVSYGFSRENKEEDRFIMHLAFFLAFTVVFCGIGFYYKYFPNSSRDDWAQREAFIRLYEREQLGLEPIDPNYVDPSKVILPPDEDLLEEDIII